jgi:hypothetical protein
MTDRTGGATLVVRTPEAIANAAGQIGDELREQYMIGFTPTAAADGKFHTVKITVSGCDKCQVRARRGYVRQ